MNIVILGAGDLGSYIASSLAKEEHNIFLIDQDQKTLERISQELDVRTVLGKASDWQLLEQLLEHKPDLFLAMTGSDEVNLSSCAVAKHLDYPKTICRIKELNYLSRGEIDFGKLFHVDHFICAEILAAQEILKLLLHPTDIHTHHFAHGSIHMRTIRVPESWEKSKVPLSKLDLPEEMIVGLIKRRVDEVIFPHGNDHIEPGDEVTVIGASHLLHNLHQVFPLAQKPLSSVTIIGGSEIGIHLSYLLQKKEIPFKIIEKDEKICERLAILFPKATILNHEEKDLQFLLSEKLDSKGAIVSAKPKDEENLLIASLAKEAGYEKVVVLLSDGTLVPTLQKLGIFFAFSEKIHLQSRILSLVHAANIVSIASLASGKAHVVEIKVSQQSELVGIPLAHLSSSLPKDLVIAVIENNGQVVVGKGKRILSANDTVVLLTSPTRIHELQALF